MCDRDKRALIGAAASAFAADVEAVEPGYDGLFAGQIELWGGLLLITGDEGNVDPGETSLGDLGADARLRFGLTSGLSIQGDVSGEITTEGDVEDVFGNALYGAGHLSWSDPGSGLLGVFGGAGSAETDDDSSHDVDFWFVGAEGQLYFDATTLYAQAGHFDAESDAGEADNAFHNAWFGRLVGRYFMSPASRLQGEVSYANGEQDTDDQDMDIIGWGARWDHQFSESFSGFVGYTGARYENEGDGGDNGSYVEHLIRVGFAFSFGGVPDLMTQDRQGANLDTPWVGHWAASGDNVD